MLAKISGQSVQTRCEVRHDDVGFTFSLRRQYGPQDLTSSRPGLALRAKTDVTRDDHFSQLALGKIVVSANGAVIRPATQAMAVFTKEVLELLSARMPRLILPSDKTIAPGNFALGAVGF